MQTTRIVAATQLILIFPALFFLIAVLTATGHAPQHDLAHMAHGVVSWYSTRVWTLWLFLLALPFAALLAGFAILVRQSLPTAPASVGTFIVAGTTFTSAGILVVVGLHMLAN